MRYLKNTDKRYVFVKIRNRLFRVLPDEKRWLRWGTLAQSISNYYAVKEHVLEFP